MLRSMTRRQVEDSNNKLFGRFVDRVIDECGIDFATAAREVYRTGIWQQILQLEDPYYYMYEDDQYELIVAELRANGAI
jgi:hypothetical protein